MFERNVKVPNARARLPRSLVVCDVTKEKKEKNKRTRGKNENHEKWQSFVKAVHRKKNYP